MLLPITLATIIFVLLSNIKRQTAQPSSDYPRTKIGDKIIICVRTSFTDI